MTTPLPGLSDSCLPVDSSCCADWDAQDAEAQARGIALAATTLLALTGYRLAGCPVTVRPCRDSCTDRTWRTYSLGGPNALGYAGSWLSPTLTSGTWVNMPCGCGGPSGCGCTSVCEVRLLGEVAEVTEVWQDGVVVDPAAYRLDPPNLLVRTDADCWPLCQDLNAGPTEPGAFAVRYRIGVLPDGLTALAMGELACEYAKACAGRPCRLPSNVTAVTRQGVSLTLDPATAFGAITGLGYVDALVQRLNPGRLAAPSVVWSPDLPNVRWSR
jgi:hypothetical protein